MANKAVLIKKCFEACWDAQFGDCNAAQFGSWIDPVDRQNAVEALWRMLKSGLLVLDDYPVLLDESGREREFRISDLLEPYEGDTDSAGMWIGTVFMLSPSGKALADAFPYTRDASPPQGFKKCLSKIFAAQGVGWEVPCPYQVSPGWEPEYVKYCRNQET